MHEEKAGGAGVRGQHEAPAPDRIEGQPSLCEHDGYPRPTKLLLKRPQHQKSCWAYNSGHGCGDFSCTGLDNCHCPKEALNTPTIEDVAKELSCELLRLSRLAERIALSMPDTVHR